LLVGSFALSAISTAVVRKLAVRRGFVAQPAADRYHQTAIPLGGGIAIFTTMAVVILTGMAVVRLLTSLGYLDWLGDSVTIHAPGFMSKIGQLVVVLLCGFVLFALGLWDDKKHLGPFFKLAVQFAVALIAAAIAEVRVEFFIESKIITSVLSAVWIVLIINAFNFLDNMDGLAAGIAVIATSILFAASALSAALSGEDFQVFVGGLAIIFVGTLLGFLVFNFPPAKIFMGDAGSLVVGFFVAFLTLRTAYYYPDAQSGQWYSVFLPLLVVAVPLYDFISVTLLRISQGKSPFVGDTQHFSHRLKKHGLTDTQTVLTLYLATLCTGLGATFLYQVNLAGAILIFSQTFMILAIIAVFETTGGNDKSCT
jgi:UDP-GlcNAc:undecaprenyl-phosphate GlcNAc-1-phosphate transferase